MRNYLCKWSNGDVVLVSARSRQEVRLILDEVADPGSCEIVQFKGPFAFELNPKMPKPPPRQRSPTGEHLNPFSNEFIAPEDPTERPLIARCAGNTGTTFYADVWQEAGGQLTAEETAALQRWRSATASQPQQSAGNGTWVTEEDLNKAGLIDNPYHVQVKLGSQEYGRYTSRLYKGITKAFFPRTYAALKAVQETEYGEEAAGKRDDAIKGLAAAVATDVYDEEKQKQLELKQAKLYVDALAGNRQAMVAVMTDQSVNVYGPAAGDEEEEEDEDSDASDEDDSDDGMDIFQSLRAGRAMELAALFEAGR